MRAVGMARRLSMVPSLALGSCQMEAWSGGRFWKGPCRLLSLRAWSLALGTRSGSLRSMPRARRAPVPLVRSILASPRAL